MCLFEFDRFTQKSLLLFAFIILLIFADIFLGWDCMDGNFLSDWLRNAVGLGLAIVAAIFLFVFAKIVTEGGKYALSSFLI